MDVIMPQLGETVTEGTVANWYKKVGDTVKADEPLFDVETDKVTTEIPSITAGVVKAILVEVGQTVPVGTVWPTSTRMAFTTPAVIDGISVVTLSVSTSNSGSSAFTVSPTFLYQLATVPSVTVSPSWGMITSIASPF